MIRCICSEHPTFLESHIWESVINITILFWLKSLSLFAGTMPSQKSGLKTRSISRWLPRYYCSLKSDHFINFFKKNFLISLSYLFLSAVWERSHEGVLQNVSWNISLYLSVLIQRLLPSSCSNEGLRGLRVNKAVYVSYSVWISISGVGHIPHILCTDSGG